MPFQLHPIELRFVAVRELQIKVFYPPVAPVRYQSAEGKLQTSTAAFDPDTHLVQVELSFESGRESAPSDEELATMKATQEQPFNLKVRIVAEFHVDVSKFPVEKVPDWAKVNAPGVMFPFLREHVFALTARCGLSPLILPLIHLPTIPTVKQAVVMEAESLQSVGSTTE